MTLTKLNYNIMTEFKTRKIRVSRVNESITNPDGTVTVTKGNVYEERPLRSVENIITFLKTDPEYSTKLKYNLFTNNLEYNGERDLDKITSCILCDVERNLGFYSPKKVKRAIEALTNEKINPYHPVKGFLDNQRWDGNNRIDSMIIDWFRIEDTPLNRLKSSVFMRAAVKRIMEPGCEFKNVLLFTNDDHVASFTFCQQLNAIFSTIDVVDIKNIKEYAPLLNEGWICYMSELRGSTAKQQMLTRDILRASEDTFVPFYEKKQVTHKRHCVFMGTTYNDKFLKFNSITPDSMYWIVDCSNTDEYNIHRNFDDNTVKQLWAEAYYKYKKDPDISRDIIKIKNMIESQNNNK